MARPRGYDKNTICIAFRLDKESLDSLRELAAKSGEYNLSLVIRNIIHDHLANLKTPPSKRR